MPYLSVFRSHAEVPESFGQVVNIDTTVSIAVQGLEQILDPLLIFVGDDEPVMGRLILRRLGGQEHMMAMVIVAGRRHLTYLIELASLRERLRTQQA